jgi:multidrug efflux pump subunit AcrB
LQDRSGGSIDQLAGYVKQLQEGRRQAPGDRPFVSTTFNPATPQVKVELDREKARTLGVPVDSVFQTLQTYLSGLVRERLREVRPVYKVFLQAEPEFTSKPDDIGKFYVRNNEGRWCRSARW